SQGQRERAGPGKAMHDVVPSGATVEGRPTRARTQAGTFHNCDKAFARSGEPFMARFPRHRRCSKRPWCPSETSMKFWSLLSLLVLITNVPSAALAVTRFKVITVSTLADLPTSAWPYYVVGKSVQPIDTVLARANQQHKLAFIVLRADWCRKCQTLAACL